MVTSMAVYMEGGGPTGATRRPLRGGMSVFLDPFLREVRRRGIRWQLVVCGGRRQAFDAFCDALVAEPDTLNILLVDSEEPVAIGVAPWLHVRQRQGDGWAKPSSADDSRLQMMVACMEAWFLADPEGMKRHFGGKCDLSKLPAANQAESRTKDVIAKALAQATQDTPAKEYRKIRDGSKLLETVDAAMVRKHCKWCERLFQTLGNAIGIPL